MIDENQHQNKRVFGLTEGLLVAGIPALGYWLAYLYEYGYCKFFQIPTSYIQIDFSTIIAATISIVGGLVMLMIIFEGLRLFSGTLSRVVLFSIFKVSIVAFVTVAIALANNWTWDQFMWFGLPLIGIIAIMEFIILAIVHRGQGNYINRMEEADRIDREYESLMDKLAHQIGGRVFRALFLVFLVSVFAYVNGAIDAADRAVNEQIADA